MAATAGLSLTLDPMGKMFQNASSLKPLGQLKPNCPGMIIGRSSTNVCFLCRSEIQDGAAAGHILTLNPMGKCSNAFPTKSRDSEQTSFCARYSEQNLNITEHC